MRKRPIIGIIGKTDGNKKTELNVDYVSAIENSGGLPLLLPYTQNTEIISSYLGLCDGFMFVGGVDVNPKRYNESVLNDTVTVCNERDDFDFLVINEVLKTEKPILAICRGCQLLNVAKGGSLIQDVPTYFNMQVCHKQIEGRYEFSHYVNVEKNSPLFKIVGESRFRVNSFHHQAIKKLGEGLCVMATSDEGIVEAIGGVGERFLRAYQWHPELLFNKDEITPKLFEEFVLACDKRAKTVDLF